MTGVQERRTDPRVGSLDDDEITERYRWVALGVVLIGTFMVILDRGSCRWRWTRSDAASAHPTASRGSSPLTSTTGLLLTPTAVGDAITMPIGGRLQARAAYNAVFVWGFWALIATIVVACFLPGKAKALELQRARAAEHDASGVRTRSA